jgi:hypothetical protein
MAAAALIAGAAVILAACSSGTSSAGKTAAPHTTGPSVSPGMHTGSHMAKTGSPKATAGTGTATTSPATSPASKTTCKHVSSLRTSLQHLGNAKTGASSASAIRADLTKIQTHVAAIKSEGGGGNSLLSTQINNLSASMDRVRSAAHGMATPPTGAQTKTVVMALTELKAQSRTTLAAMNAVCPK